VALSESVTWPLMPASEDAGGLKAVALSKLKAQLEEVQQHNTALSSENDTLKDKCAVLQQVGA